MRITDESIHGAVTIVRAALGTASPNAALDHPEDVAKLLEIVAAKLEELRSGSS